MPMNERDLEQAEYFELCYYTLAHADPSFIHQHVVDAFAAQHADEETKPISLAFALIGLYLHLEKGYSGREVQRAHMRLARRRKKWPMFPLPENRGGLTVFEVMVAPPGPERDAMVEKWCLSVWQAYVDSHGNVVALVKNENRSREE